MKKDKLVENLHKIVYNKKYKLANLTPQQDQQVSNLLGNTPQKLFKQEIDRTANNTLNHQKATNAASAALANTNTEPKLDLPEIQKDLSFHIPSQEEIQNSDYNFNNKAPEISKRDKYISEVQQLHDYIHKGNTGIFTKLARALKKVPKAISLMDKSPSGLAKGFATSFNRAAEERYNKALIKGSNIWRRGLPPETRGRDVYQDYTRREPQVHDVYAKNLFPEEYDLLEDQTNSRNQKNS